MSLMFKSAGNMSTEADEPVIQIEEEVDENLVPSSKRIKTSTTLEFSEKFVDDKGLPKAKCKNCNKTYMARDGGGTSNFIKHAVKCVGRGNGSYPPLDQEKYREKISKVIVKHNYPFTFVEHEGIIDLLYFLHPDVKSITRNTAKSDVLKVFRK
ncbi:unnamed protein product [Vicia faba]|uniref:BED-type domain-containing protein n=1 Tax=Vicia faba TaxID=3906 RepID=A0AAV0YWH7_VICFA|nr:unnamed protein product [Vicia faba]